MIHHQGEGFGDVTNAIERQNNIQLVHFVTGSVAKRIDDTQIAATGGYASNVLATAEDHRPFLRPSNLLADLQGIRRRRAHRRSIRQKRQGNWHLPHVEDGTDRLSPRHRIQMNNSISVSKTVADRMIWQEASCINGPKETQALKKPWRRPKRWGMSQKQRLNLEPHQAHQDGLNGT